MWTVIYITCDYDAVLKLKQKFSESQILMRVRTVQTDDTENKCYEVMVPQAEVAQAQDIIIEELN